MVSAPGRSKALMDDVDFAMSSRSFFRFLDFVKVVEPPTMQNNFGGGPTPFVKWDHLIPMAENLQTTRLTIVGKARQNGFSWLVAAYAAWLLRFHAHAKVPIISQGQVEAGDMVKRVKQVLENLPEPWKVEYDIDGKLEVGVDGMDTMARALASTKNAGRSLTASVVIIDEAEAHEYLPLSMNAVKPIIDAGGQIIMGSTIDKSKSESVFRNYYTRSPGNGWVKYFWGWQARPGRDQAWWDQTFKEAAEDDTIGISPELYMEQEYPGTEEEMLAASRTIGLFNLDMLTQMQQQVRDPVATFGPINVYQHRGIGVRYVAATDAALGVVGGDDSVSIVLDVTNNVVVADIQSNELKPEELTDYSVQMLKMYDYPEWAIERPGPGDIVLAMAKQLRYPRIHRQRLNQYATAIEPGWKTTPTTRVYMLSALREFVDSGRLTVPSKNGLAQFFALVVKTMKSGGHRIEAQYGSHDDYPFAVAIANQIREYAIGYGETAVKVRSRFGV